MANLSFSDVISSLQIKSIDLIKCSSALGPIPDELVSLGGPGNDNDYQYVYKAELRSVEKIDEGVFFSCVLRASKFYKSSALFSVEATYYGMIFSDAFGEDDAEEVARLGVKFGAWSRFKNLYGSLAVQSDVQVSLLLDNPDVDIVEEDDADSED